MGYEGLHTTALLHRNDATHGDHLISPNFIYINFISLPSPITLYPLSLCIPPSPSPITFYPPITLYPLSLFIPPSPSSITLYPSHPPSLYIPYHFLSPHPHPLSLFIPPSLYIPRNHRFSHQTSESVSLITFETCFRRPSKYIYL